MNIMHAGNNILQYQNIIKLFKGSLYWATKYSKQQQNASLNTIIAFFHFVRGLLKS